MTASLADLGERLTTAWLGRPHEHHRSVDSTNARALAWLAEGGPHGGLVTADAQTAGRGRRGRAWHSAPRASLYVTALLRPPAGASLGALGLAVGLGLSRGLPAAAEVGLKWPNDLMAGGRKLGGVLCEARWTDGRAQIAAGFGINVRLQPWPADLAAVATSLQAQGVETTPVELASSVLASLESTLDAYLSGGFAAIRDDYLARSTVVGQRVRVGEYAAPQDAALAEAVGLDEDGALLVRDADAATPRRIEAADVWLAQAGTGTSSR